MDLRLGSTSHKQLRGHNYIIIVGNKLSSSLCRYRLRKAIAVPIQTMNTHYL